MAQDEKHHREAGLRSGPCSQVEELFLSSEQMKAAGKFQAPAHTQERAHSQGLARQAPCSRSSSTVEIFVCESYSQVMSQCVKGLWWRCEWGEEEPSWEGPGATSC